MRPRDLLKLGQLYLGRGLWQDRRIVSEAWVEESTRSHVPRDSPPDGEGARLDYGYHWWVRHLEPRDNPQAGYFLASGGGAQLLFVFFDLDLLVLFTGSHYGTDFGNRQHSALLNKYISPALRR